jgi:hypothetical protein
MNTMTEALVFTLPANKLDDSGKLVVDVKNSGNTAVGGSQRAIIKFILRRSAWGDAASLTELDKGTKYVSVSGVSTSGGGGTWTAVLLKPSENVQLQTKAGNQVDSTHFIELRLMNNIQFSDGKIARLGADQQGTLAAQGTLKVTLPLKRADKGALLSDVVCRYAQQPPTHLQVDLSAPAVALPPKLPMVTFEACKPDKQKPHGQKIENTVALPPGTAVVLHWEVTNGTAVEGTLMGLLPGNKTSLPLKPAGAGYKPDKGDCPVSIFGSQAYAISLLVQIDSNTKVTLEKSLLLDTVSGDDYGYVEATPWKSLPYGLVNIHWKAWNVEKADVKLTYPPNTFRNNTIPAPPDHNGATEGRQQALAPANGTLEVRLELGVSGRNRPYVRGTDTGNVEVETWQNAGFEKLPAAKPAQLVYDGAGQLILGVQQSNNLDPSLKLYKVAVGLADNNQSWSFAPVGADKQGWVAIAERANRDAGGFVALRLADNGRIELVEFDQNGTAVGNALTLPEDLSNQKKSMVVGTISSVSSFKAEVNNQGPREAVSLSNKGVAIQHFDNNRTLRTWDMVGGKMEKELGNGSVFAVSPDGATIATCITVKGGQTIKLWDSASGSCKLTLQTDFTPTEATTTTYMKSKL